MTWVDENGQPTQIQTRRRGRPPTGSVPPPPARYRITRDGWLWFERIRERQLSAEFNTFSPDDFFPCHAGLPRDTPPEPDERWLARAQAWDDAQRRTDEALSRRMSQVRLEYHRTRKQNWLRRQRLLEDGLAEPSKDVGLEVLGLAEAEASASELALDLKAARRRRTYRRVRARTVSHRRRKR